MKNIFIIGVPRSGKSTLSKLIKRNYPIYNQLSFEAIRNGFIETQPELNMGNRTSDARRTILPKHIVTEAHWSNNILSCPSLVEGDFCTIEELNNLIDENDIIICLGFGCRSIEEIIRSVKKNDTSDDYTKDWSDEKMKKHFYNLVDKDKENYDYCIKNNINYYDTYDNRNLIFEKIIEEILLQDK